MFNKGEIAVFRRVGLTPVFFGETMIGTKLPCLTYMLVFENMAAAGEFGPHEKPRAIVGLMAADHVAVVVKQHAGDAVDKPPPVVTFNQQSCFVMAASLLRPELAGLWH